MIEIASALVGLAIGTMLGLGTARRYAGMLAVAYVGLAVAIVAGIALGRPLAGLVFAAALILAFIVTLANEFRDLPSLAELPYWRRLGIAVFRPGRLLRESDSLRQESNAE